MLNVIRHSLGVIRLPMPPPWLLAWVGFICTLIGGSYYLLKVYHEFIKKPKQKK